jgi:hypothetical protein
MTYVDFGYHVNMQIVDMLTVEDLVCFFDQDDDEVVESLLGSMNHAIQQIMLKLYHVYNYEFHSHLYGFNYKMLVERYGMVHTSKQRFYNLVIILVEETNQVLYG